MRANESNLTRFAQNVKTYVSHATQTPDIVAIFEVAAGDAVRLRNLVGNDVRIDWGDNLVEYTDGVDISHTYAADDKYVCKIYNVTSIGYRAFSNCTSLTSIKFSDNVISIGEQAVRICKNLKHIALGANLKEILTGAFYDDVSLKSIVIPKSVETMGDIVFHTCTSLTIYCECEATSQLSGWNTNWNPSNCPVVWGYKPKDYPEMVTEIQPLSDEEIADIWDTTPGVEEISKFTMTTGFVPVWNGDTFKDGVALDSVATKTETNKIVDNKISAFNTSTVQPNAINFGYAAYNAGDKFPIRRNGYYMVYCNNAKLRLIEGDGSELLKEMKQLVIMASPITRKPTANTFGVAGTYWTGDGLSFANLSKLPVEGFRTSLQDGAYITCDEDFWIYQMVKGDLVEGVVAASSEEV